MKPPRAWSLLHRWVLSFVISFILLIFFANASLYYLLQSGLEGQRNALINDRLSAIATLLKSPAHGLEEIHRRIEVEWPARSGENVYVEVQSAGKRVAISPKIPADLYAEFENRLGPSNPRALQRSENFKDAAGSMYRGQWRNEENSVDLASPILVRVAVGAEQGQQFLSTFRNILFFVFILSLLISLLLGWFVAYRGVTPLFAMTGVVQKIDSQNLSDRIVLENLPIELQTLSRAFNQTLDRLQGSFKQISRFSSDIAHELRTPVATMMGEIEVTLSRARNGEEYREILISLMEECSRIHRITDSLLFLARAESPQPLAPKMEALLVNKEIKSMVDFFEPQASEKNISLSLSSPLEKINILAESTLFQRVMANLISNAIQYTPDGGLIEVGFRASSSCAEIWVKDNGPGLSLENQEKIFDRFYRVDPSRSLKSGGFGLGLAIVKSIVELHQGRIRVESRLGEGSQFMIEWPLA